ncbi:MAG: hypothetical protein HYR93_01820 [Chloroflexi bacterium]|nr:hypothetical protein [Chloroflexota bacterium]
MDEIRFYQKPWFISFVLGILLLGIYLYDIFFQGGQLRIIMGIGFDLFVFLLVLLPACVFFYAQFVLPIHKHQERGKIGDRLWLHAFNGHGPAIFVKNGRLVERSGESEKEGPGVLWLDTASAVVTRTDTAFKNFLEPGVHFTDKDEKIASIISLHTQSHRIGPEKGDKPFDPQKENPTGEEQIKYAEVQARRMTVSAMTRDGIEVVPVINITFKLDATPAKGREKGSRFGFDKDAVEKAARGEGISASSKPEEMKHVAWNQLPSLIAADLWREFLSKYTLNELFSASLDPLGEIPQPGPTPKEDEQESLGPARAGFFAKILKKINDVFEDRLKQLIPEHEFTGTESDAPEKPAEKKDESKRTALQIINQMIRARMTQAAVVVLDECGRQAEGFTFSDEYKTLTERGLKISSVSVSGLYFSEDIEKQIVEKWTTTWMANAKADRSRIERLSSVYNANGRQKALQDHALTLSRAISKENPADIASAVKILLQRTQSDVKSNDRLLRRTTTEVEGIDEIINWMGV